jgi:5'-nucleotidase (lipoprotein e(P4) family)
MIEQVMVLCFAVSLLMSCSTKPLTLIVQDKIVNATQLTVATWNVEHLAYPINTGCKPRTAEELEQLKNYAQSLNADVVALQEVASLEAVALLFPSEQWQIIMSTRPDNKPYICRGSGSTSTQQKVAFAVNKRVNVNNVTPFEALSLGRPSLRYGLEIEVESDFGLVSLLNVHLKSGCFVDDLFKSDRKACQTLSLQAPILDSWIADKEVQGKPYVVLGDFNHRLSAPYNKLTQMVVNNGKGEKREIINTSAAMNSCHARYSALIDHIFVGNVNWSMSKYNTSIHYFGDMKIESMLSDHCAITTTLIREQPVLSNAIKWQTTSKEYQLITRGIYQAAEKKLADSILPDSSWVVVMDVDETILNNSAYQVKLEKTGESYTPKSWNHWVESRLATLVPGAASFIQEVFNAGGKVALITNREKQLDSATWQNLSKFIPITFKNTCLVGRTQADKKAINGHSIINDKDLRRQQLQRGKIDCYSTESKKSFGQSPHIIFMQIGDNIEDISATTQEEANINELRSRLNNDVFLLPNALYGSW